MQRRVIVLVAVLLSCAAVKRELGYGDELAVTGLVPPCTTEVIAAARAHGCKVRGSIEFVAETWTDPRFPGKTWVESQSVDGYGVVLKVRTGPTALDTALGHGLGHYCLGVNSPEEDAPNKYQAMIYEEVRRGSRCAANP